MKNKSKLTKLAKIVNINQVNSIMPAIDPVTNRIIPKKPKPDWSFFSFNIKPLSVAKFFYQKGIELNSTMQDLLYLSYLEVLKKERCLLFTEEFQAWRAGPTLGSVFLRMHNYFRQNETYEGLFDKYPTIKNPKIIQHQVIKNDKGHWVKKSP